MSPIRSKQESKQKTSKGGTLPSVSVVICTYNPDNFLNLKDVIDSLIQQSHKVDEIIVVVDGEQMLGDKICSKYNRRKEVKVIVTREGMGVTRARNIGIRAATGDIIAFTDDDALTDKRWIARLLATYQITNAPAVGGKILPIWLSAEPEHLPEELYWLVGVTHAGFAEEKVTEVRDAFGPNMSFKRQVFEAVGYFNERLGFDAHRTSYIQGEEPEFGLRVKNKLGKGVIYDPEAIVYHKVSPSKLKLGNLIKRSFYQGYTKALIQKLFPLAEPLYTERLYLKFLILNSIPRRAKNIFSGPNRFNEAKQVSVLLLCVGAVGIGFIYGNCKLGVSARGNANVI
ncbi:MAG: glycosyltransferase [Chloroflexota bacterium]|nr:MAG: glycosyltransferase [Chloroflexota bacterium]